jgi:FkbM family methyltransferase
MDLHFNQDPAFTKWAVRTGALHAPFVVVDIGVQGGENPRWALLGDHLVIHGLDAIKEVVEALEREHRSDPNRHYHWIAAGSADGEREFYFNAADPCSSSFYAQGTDRFGSSEGRVEQARKVLVRRLDSLLTEGTIDRPDFLKVDVEGFEKDVLLGASETLASVLGVEVESSFNVSPSYPKSHFATMQEILLERFLLVFDINFNRVPRATFQHALARKSRRRLRHPWSVGKPATLNVLFCRDLIDEADHSENYATLPAPASVDGLIKMMIVYELHGLNDIAVDTAQRFRDTLAPRLDVERAVDLLADPFCRTPRGATAAKGWQRQAVDTLSRRIDAVERSTGWRVRAPLRRIKGLLLGG